MPIPWLAIAGAATPFLSQGLNFLGGNAGVRKQYHMNKALAERQFELDMAMTEYMNAYNTPAKQRERMEAAGYNANLFYGTGTPGNMSSAPQAPRIQPPDIQSIYADLGTKLQQSRLLGAQADLTDQRVKESGVKQSLMEQQRKVAAANPYLDKRYFDGVIQNMMTLADTKSEDFHMKYRYLHTVDGKETTLAAAQVEKSIEMLYQKFNLGAADQKIKAEIFKSKEFQNDLQKIQVDWMKNSEVTPQHIYMGIMLLLQKML